MNKKMMVSLVAGLVTLSSFTGAAFAAGKVDRGLPTQLEKRDSSMAPADWKPSIPKEYEGKVKSMERKGNIWVIQLTHDAYLKDSKSLSNGVLSTSNQIAPHVSPSFPSNAIWTWSNTNLQSWIGPQETDAVSGTHYNLHVQPRGGGFDYSNYHITYDGWEWGGRSWRVVDTVRETDVVYSSWSLTEASAADDAAAQLAASVGETYGADLGSALLSEAYGTELAEAYLTLLLL